jgi:hypothetical protein
LVVADRNKHVEESRDREKRLQAYVHIAAVGGIGQTFIHLINMQGLKL